MSSADTLFDGIPALKWRRCVEALFEPSARNKIVEIVAKEEAPERALQLCKRGLSQEILRSSALRRFIAGSAAIIVLVFLLENWFTKEPRSRLIPL